MISRQAAFETISALVERFDEQKAFYKKSEYNETLTRRDFIDPFFKALGWDVDNSQGYAETYREVIHEDRVKVGKATKAPDYSFRLPGGKRLFFVEAKKPSVFIKDEITPAYQVRRYGWSAKLPISIITDFEEFAVYDCLKKPAPTDKAAHGRIKYLTYNNYLSEWDFIWNTFSKERVLKGSFDQFVQSDKVKRGTTTVDAAFLHSLDEWRTYLAQNMAARNKALSEEELNFAVQHIIDRIIFLRIAEDRGIEPYGNLRDSVKTGESYGNLQQLFHLADQKYNSGLFDFSKDRITGGLTLDNKIIKNIINDLYYPASPYEFSVLSVEILGSAYEQFLGKQIKLTGWGRAAIEEKPEVRKAGGVYYTPQYIVDYIVANTVGKLVQDKTPKEVAKLKVVDPACGSGSFLLGAYQYLLDWHRNYYSQHPVSSKGKEQPLRPDGQLSTAEKKRILLANIYGVDLDANAVEVTKLSLLLKCMEGETEASIATQMKLFHDRILPTLDNNIKSGNSLVDEDFYDQELPVEEVKKVKPFSWKKAFPGVFKSGGFDAVIGNPPYVRQELLGNQKPYFQQRYQVHHGMADLYSYFFEKGIGLLKADGLFGIIVANKWMRAAYGEPLRRWLKNQSILEITDFGDLPVFQGATTYPCIVIAAPPQKKKAARQSVNVTDVKTLDFESLQDYVDENKKEQTTDALHNEGWNLAGEGEQALLKKIQAAGVPLGEYVQGKIYYGIKTGFNEAFVIDEATKKRLIKEDKRSAEVIKPFLAGRDIKRYQPPQSGKYLILFPKGFTNLKGNHPKNPWKWLQENFPAIAAHLKPYRESAEKRYDKGEFWWELRACDYYDAFEKPKIMLPDIALTMQANYDNDNFFCVNTAYAIPVNDKYLLAILNSLTVQFFYSRISPSIRGGYLRFIRQYLELIPIPKAVKEKSEIEKYVNQLLQLNADLSAATLPGQKDQLQSRIAWCEEKLNALVYRLYDLTEEEIAIIENKSQ